MGALHDGHLALVAKARALADRVIATIFVNPLAVRRQRGPRPLSAAGSARPAKLEAAGCDLLSAAVRRAISIRTASRPMSASRGQRALGRRGPARAISTASRRLSPSCSSRPRPDIAIFGEKDFQQLAVIRRMTRDLGLASGDRRRADRARCRRPRVVVAQRLSQPRTSGAAGPAAALEGARERSSRERVDAALGVARCSLEQAGFATIDYVALVDAATLEPLESRPATCG